MWHFTRANGQFLTFLRACVCAGGKIALWCDPKRFDDLAPVYLSQLVFSYLPSNPLLLSFPSLPHSQAHLHLHGSAESLLTAQHGSFSLLSGNFLLSVLHVPCQVPSSMIFLAPQRKLILPLSELPLLCYYSICTMIIISSLVLLCYIMYAFSRETKVKLSCLALH